MGTFLSSPQGDILTESRQVFHFVVDARAVVGYIFPDESEPEPAVGVVGSAACAAGSGLRSTPEKRNPLPRPLSGLWVFCFPASERHERKT